TYTAPSPVPCPPTGGERVGVRSSFVTPPIDGERVASQPEADDAVPVEVGHFSNFTCTTPSPVERVGVRLSANKKIIKIFYKFFPNRETFLGYLYVLRV
ncbi:MAG: hypothetical protein WBO32_05605, partial [Cyclobacteriaceae bacterium]